MKFDFSKAKWEEKGSYITARVFDISETSFVQMVEIPAGATVKKHYHRKQTEVFYILKGEAKLGIEDTEYDAKEGDIFLCKPESIHWVVNSSQNSFKVLVFKYNWEENDTEWIE
ncbi:hypothetical protein Asulf_02164 [Archaeoglobus sulfaticallidus PM70-1]|uniref:Cupin type-2 domain-containing protein n=1 Tax=Archaeoglobus sulfaticallidus PM70-1 TaxID=387631 RepID=N0BGI9_9EURY|nr:cupin domain-containing protein [Archaeoglobus sulfaticallidus]AGK62118.1 hypothetical protein Asulf_02164 [Archaeoglobus sulfaticallidus PM70-1]